MTSITCRHLEFYACNEEQLKENNNKLYIHVGSHMINGVVYEDKLNHIGWLHKSGDSWCFRVNYEKMKFDFCQETLEVIAVTLRRLNKGTISYNIETGEWKLKI